MGSTATSKAVKKTPAKVIKDSGKKKSVRKAAQTKAKSRATPVKKKAAARKKATAPKKATSKKTIGKKAAAKKKAPRKKTLTRAGTKSVHTPDRHADVTAVAGTTPGPADTTATDAVQGDAKSLSWMAAQAANALKAVRANQSARAQDLLAKAEITAATPVKSHKEEKTRVEPDVPETKQDMQAVNTPAPVKAAAKKPAEPDRPETKQDKKAVTTPKPVKAVVKQVTKEPPSVVPAEQTAPAQSAPVVPEPNKRETVQAAVSHVAPARPEITESIGEKQLDSPPAHVIAATSTIPGNRRSKRLILLTGTIVLAGVLGARIWFSNNDTADVTMVQDSAGTEQVSPVTEQPPPEEAITRVASEATVRPATAETQKNSWSPAEHPAWPEPASTLETLPTVETMPQETSADEAVGTETPQQQAATTPAAPQATSPVAPQPGYYAPAYGYYRQQPVRQQPYYRPRYSR